MSVMFTTPAQAQVSVQARAGVGMSKLQGLSFMENSLSYKVGLGLDIPYLLYWSLQPTLYFVQKGANFKGVYGSGGKEPVTLNCRLNYFELPVYFAFKQELREDMEVSLKAGPYVALGIVGKAYVSADNQDFHRTYVGELFTDGTDFDDITWLTIKSGDTFKAKADAFKKFDAGVAFGADFRYQHYLIGLDCSWGILPASDGILKDVSSKYNLRNISAHLTLGYQF